jgi:hypothetical protein
LISLIATALPDEIVVQVVDRRLTRHSGFIPVSQAPFFRRKRLRMALKKRLFGHFGRLAVRILVSVAVSGSGKFKAADRNGAPHVPVQWLPDP